MKKKWLLIGGGVVVVALLVGVNIMRAVRGNVVNVQFATVRTEDITSRVRAPGKIEPKTQVKVSADVPGKILNLAVQEGDAVRRGQLMLQIDDTQYRALRDQVAARLASARERVKEAELSYKVAGSNFKRQRTLYADKLLSDAEWDQASSTHESARVGVATAREEVARATAELTASRDNLSKCRFIAPFDGVVSALNVEQGEIVVVGTMNNPGTQILVVSDLSRMLVRADVDETDVVDVVVGQKATITVDALPDTTFPGTVFEVGNTAKRTASFGSDGQTNFEVKVVFDDQVDAIRPGMTADVEIDTGTREGTMGVPIQSVVVRTEKELEEARKGKNKSKPGDAIAAGGDSVAAEIEEGDVEKEKELTGIFVVREGVAEFVEVRTGIASETRIEVFGDFESGNNVVSGPYKSLRELKPGTKVKRQGKAKAKG